MHVTLRCVPSADEDDELGQTVVTLVEEPSTDDAIVADQFQIVVIGNGTFVSHPLLDGAPVTIGRSNRCEITVDDESISRRHAILQLGETVTIEDLGSANGTRVRGQRISPGHPISITVGELVGLGAISIILQQRSHSVRLRRMWTPVDFDARLAEECARSERSGAAFALLRVHSSRRVPALLVEETLTDTLRESDIVSKYGPHEYQVLLPDTPPAKADEACRRIDGNLVTHGVKCRIVVACCPRDGQRPYQLVAKLQTPKTKEPRAIAATGIVVSDAQMQSLHRLVEQIADSRLGVLLLGETGVGKDVFARAVHRASPRAAGPFVELNCAALTETLLESELFGHEKGSFTHATSAKAGLIETAEGGTLLLDEIGDMPLTTQVKLLRVIEDSQLRRVGGLHARSIDVRFVAATNRDLEAQIARGAFRSDLFFRLNGVTIVIPPLRERLAEIEPLSQAFISGAGSWDGPQPSIALEALELMKAYSWPGNVRELKHVIERAVLLCGGGPIRVEHLPAEKMRANVMIGRSTKLTPPVDTLVAGTPAPRASELPSKLHPKRSEEEQQWIMQALERMGGNQTLAAQVLGISRRTLVNRLNDYEQVQRPRKDKKKKQLGE